MRATAFGAGVDFVDAVGTKVRIPSPPRCVVSLVPAVTEMLFAIDAGDAVCGITYHDTYPATTADKTIVGGFFSPDMERIEVLKPDLILVADLHDKLRQHFEGRGVKVAQLAASSIQDIHHDILLLGRIFDRAEEAKKLVDRSEEMLAVVSRKVERIPIEDRQRVIRLMGHARMMVPGDDSFQNDFIRAAGGVAPHFGRNGNVIELSLSEWQRFNPQVIYSCGDDRAGVEKILHRPGWQDVEAVRNGRIEMFPCELTCRPSPRAANFVQQLAASIYHDQFTDRQQQVTSDRVIAMQAVDTGLGFVKDAAVVTMQYLDFANKTLLIDFKQPQAVLSTLEGYREGVTTVGNHYTPPPLWKIAFAEGLPELQRRVAKVAGRDPDHTALLFTGADMDNLSMQHQQFKGMRVTALVTAGVKSNAVRMSQDEGRFYEPGTINIIILSNMQLTRRAMARAIISATEAKTAALADLDIRSTYTPELNQATGTGTDNILVVAGQGTPIDNAGGHSKMGELIARAVYAGVKGAIAKQNGLVAGRSIFQRLAERKINLAALIGASSCGGPDSRSSMVSGMEKLLLDSRYAGFLAMTLQLSDIHAKGLADDLSAYDSQCLLVANEIADNKMDEVQDCLDGDEATVVVVRGLNALYNGLLRRGDAGDHP